MSQDPSATPDPFQPTDQPTPEPDAPVAPDEPTADPAVPTVTPDEPAPASEPVEPGPEQPAEPTPSDVTSGSLVDGTVSDPTVGPVEESVADKEYTAATFACQFCDAITIIGENTHPAVGRPKLPFLSAVCPACQHQMVFVHEGPFSAGASVQETAPGPSPREALARQAGVGVDYHVDDQGNLSATTRPYSEPNAMATTQPFAEDQGTGPGGAPVSPEPNAEVSTQDSQGHPLGT